MEKLSKADLEKEAILNPEKAEKRKQMSYNRIVCFLCGLYHRFYGSPGHGKEQHYE